MLHAPLREGAPLDVFHRDEHPIAVHSHVVDREHVGMLEPCECLRFSKHPLVDPGLGLSAQDLQRDPPSQPGVLGQEHAAVRPPTQRSHQLEVSDPQPLLAAEHVTADLVEHHPGLDSLTVARRSVVGTRTR